MTKIKYISILVTFLLFSCEKVIDVNLNEANPVIVIEGNLTKTPVSVEVKISRTGSYFGSAPVTKISNASVLLEDDLGARFILDELEKGLYKSRNVHPQIDKNYKLSVEVEGKIYEAFSKLNPPVTIDSLTSAFSEGFAFLDAGYYVTIYFEDPAEVKNYYQLKIYKNGKLKNDFDNLIIFDDNLFDGQKLEIQPRNILFIPGDTATIELNSLDKNAYEYFKTFQEVISTNPGSAAPANPNSNFTNGALGYFSAYSTGVKSIEIKDIAE
ncbi:MAG: DUF4249 domain-containing protein [Prolixibacteraceae bacterium]|nr:DUF4249 domain-containing protein [Prolixibacteraceae bacterium]MBT6007234.1 DUF4249 domain-containing protein [Prolixibacteraceae bacterium]MBT6762940.1 DUF4249 domain-containing protein [Prolixibacteraceae bacterium]MBT7000261.1 DUF4249 domain-containing protein [Prolixibacteraceae bacterium]MBT7395128.1 DUF4249 domain-containing protein [Prolixibacteraceae bacterium]